MYINKMPYISAESEIDSVESDELEAAHSETMNEALEWVCQISFVFH